MQNKRYYFLKLKEDFFQEATIQIIEGQPDGLLYTNLLLKLYLMSLKNDGLLLLTKDIPYTPAMLASLTHHEETVVEAAFTLFKQLGIVEELEDGTLYMSQLLSMLGNSSAEAGRKRKERALANKQPPVTDATTATYGQVGSGLETTPTKNREKFLSTVDGVVTHSPPFEQATDFPMDKSLPSALAVVDKLGQNENDSGQCSESDGYMSPDHQFSPNSTQNAPDVGQNADTRPQIMDNGSLVMDILGQMSNRV